MPMVSSIPTRHRPIFDGCDTPEEKMAAAMAEYAALKDEDENGLDFSNKTSMWIAFERDIESQREDRLFYDPLAKHFAVPYGQRLSDSMSFGLSFSVFDKDGSVGFGLEGHVMYTAARTKLINNQVEHWLENIIRENGENTSCQVLNLGAGFDTRPYWMESLRRVNLYWEIDTGSVIAYKQKVLDQLKAAEELPVPVCPNIESIPMDFSKESIEDLPSKYGYQSTMPSCWILEGLIMYLNRPEVELLLDRMTVLSAPTSFLILNFSTNTPNGPSIDEIDERLKRGKWRKEKRLMFGQSDFHFGRYPVDKPANEILGFSMYMKE